MSDPTQPSVFDRSSLARFFRWLFSWRSIRRILIVLAWGITIVALLYAEENWRGRRAWTRYRQQLEGRGEQLDLKAFIPKAVPDDQNFAATPLIQSWFEKRGSNRWDDNYARVQKKVSSSKDRGSRHLTDLVAWEMGFAAIRSGATNLKNVAAFQSEKQDRESRAKAAPAVLEGLKDNEAKLAELRAASKRPHSRYPVVYDLDNPWGILLPHLASVKSVCQRLNLKACAELAAGQSQSALEDVKLILFLADSLKEEPFLISHLVRFAGVQIATQPIWEGLAEHRWSDAHLQELQARLQEYNFLADLKQAMDAERATGILTVDLIRKKGLGYLMAIGDDTEAVLPPPHTPANLISPFIPRGWYYQEQFNYCRLFQEQLGGTFDTTQKRVSPSQVKSNSCELDREFAGGKAIIRHHVMARLLLPALGRVSLKATTAQTAADQAALACALERYRLANGNFPEGLNALVPRFISQLPHDALTGEPYKYRGADPGRFALYSIGWDEKDDGGVPGKVLFDDRQGDWVWNYPIK